MNAKVQMWGNSLALRIPKAFASSIGLESETHVDLLLEEDRIVVKKSPDRGPTLGFLLSQITPENIHDEIDYGAPVGRETW